MGASMIFFFIFLYFEILNLRCSKGFYIYGHELYFTSFIFFCKDLKKPVFEFSAIFQIFTHGRHYIFFKITNFIIPFIFLRKNLCFSLYNFFLFSMFLFLRFLFCLYDLLCFYVTKGFGGATLIIVTHNLGIKFFLVW